MRCTVLEGEERPDATAAAVANDDEHLHLEGAHGVLDGGPGAAVLGLQIDDKTKGDRTSAWAWDCENKKNVLYWTSSVYAYLVVGWHHGGDVADGEGLAGLQAQGHRRAHTGVGAGEHHVLQRKITVRSRRKEGNHHQAGFPWLSLIDKQVGRSVED